MTLVKSLLLGGVLVSLPFPAPRLPILLLPSLLLLSTFAFARLKALASSTSRARKPAEHLGRVRFDIAFSDSAVGGDFGYDFVTNGSSSSTPARRPLSAPCAAMLKLA